MSFLFQKIILSPIYHEIAQTLQKAGVKSVLDAGCGNGDFCNYLAQLNFKVVGIDKESSRVRYCIKQTSSLLANPPQYTNADLTKISIAKRFEAVAFLFVLHELSSADRAIAFQRISTYLATNGIIVLLDYQKPSSNGMASLLWSLIKCDERITQLYETSSHYDHFVANIEQSFERWIGDLPIMFEPLLDKSFCHSTIRLLILRTSCL